MKDAITMHGWCSDQRNWEIWAKFFQSNGWYWQNVERGYGKQKSYEPKWNKIKNAKTSKKRLLICHSLGIHLISKQLLEKSTEIVLINSFSRFIPSGKESRSLKIALYGMQKHLGQETEVNMLLAFLRKASLPNEFSKDLKGPLKEGISTSGREKLIADLQVLINSNGLPTELPSQAKVLVVSGDQDAIVLPSTTNELIKDLQQHLKKTPSHWIIKGAGHFINQPEVIRRVKNWAEEN